jgi:hydroxypyruvate reductase
MQARQHKLTKELGDAVVKAALDASDPARAVALEAPCWLPRAAGTLDEIVVIAAGKAAGSMVEGLIEALRGSALAALPVRGLVVTRHGAHLPLSLPPGLEASTAGHPTPDAAGVVAAQRALDLASSAGAETLVIVLLSGGGSSLLTFPAQGISLADAQDTNALLLGCGASIDEVNCVRKHTSRIAGGRLGLAARGAAQVITLALSDVVGDRADVIASGPTVADPTTYADALDVLRRYGLRDRLPTAVLALLEAGALGASGAFPESPKACMRNAEFHLVGGNSSALEAVAAALEAEPFGLRSHVLTNALQGEAREVARVLASILYGVAGPERRRAPFRRPCALVFGGETTVSLPPDCVGRGGRNQELALAVAVAMQAVAGPEPRSWTCIALGTDGSDGPTDAAGAVSTERTVAQGLSRGADARDYLTRHDSYNFFIEGGLLITGPSGTNVGDLTVLVAH